MAKRIFVIKDVPTDQKARIEAGFIEDGAESVDWAEQDNDLWTCTATFPEEAAGAAAGGGT